MKKLMIISVLMAFLTLTSCNAGQQNADDATDDGVAAVANDSMAAFESFCGHFGKSSAFAYTEVGGRKILLVSQETFGNDENADLEAVDASVFALDDECKIVALGSIRSQGTLYPVSLLDDKLMVAGHHFVYVYSVRGEIPELVLDSFVEGDSPELMEMFRTFEKGTSIKFEKRNVKR